MTGGSKISSTILEGFTQTVLSYKSHNISNNEGFPIYIVDTPGLADTKISEVAIVSMLQKWIKDNRQAQIICYFPCNWSNSLPSFAEPPLTTFYTLPPFIIPVYLGLKDEHFKFSVVSQGSTQPAASAL